MLGTGKLPLIALQYAFNHTKLCVVSVERSDFEEALINSEFGQFLSADDVADVVAKVTHRQLVGGIGRHDNVDVFWPRLRQPRQTPSGDGRTKMIQTVEQKNQRPLLSQSTGDFFQCRHEIFAQIVARVHIVWLANTVHLSHNTYVY